MSKKTTKTANLEQKINDITTRLDDTKKDVQTWEDSLRRASNSELYRLLSECFDVYRQLVGNTELKRRLNKALDSRNIKSTAGTSLQLKIIRYVFGRTGEEHTYARALKKAHLDLPKATSFVEWLKEHGGPSGIRRQKSANGISKSKQHIENGKLHYEASPELAKFAAIEQLCANTDADHEFAVVLVRPCKKDPARLEVVFGSSQTAVVNKVLEVAGRGLSEEDVQCLKPDIENTVPDTLINLAASKGSKNEVSA